MAYLGGLGGFGLKKSDTAETIISTVSALPDEKKVNKITQSLTLIRDAKLTPEERARIPTDYKDIIDLTALNNAWCWINCSMRPDAKGLLSLKTSVDSFKNAYESLNILIANKADVNEIFDEFKKFVNLRIQLNIMKSDLQSKFPPGSARSNTKPPPKEGAEAGVPLWAEPLARIYNSVGGPKNVNTTTFIKHLQNRRSELSPEQQATVHGTLSEFGMRRGNAAIGLRNYLTKSKSSLPESFKSIFKANQFTTSKSLNTQKNLANKEHRIMMRKAAIKQVSPSGAGSLPRINENAVNESATTKNASPITTMRKRNRATRKRGRNM